MEGEQDWSTGRSSERQASLEAEMGKHDGHTISGKEPTPAKAGYDLRKIDSLVPAVANLNLAAPVLLSPPGKRNPRWVAKSDAQNRTLRTTVEFDPATLAMTGRKDFGARHVIDRVIGIGISAHEGQLFGWVNQAMSVLAALGLLLLSISAVVLWLRRRPSGVLGPPTAPVSQRLGAGMLLLLALLALAFPLFGVSLVLVLLVERLVLRRVETVRTWLGLPE
jgi:uncharacterized iron-regulated membrane protein